MRHCPTLNHNMTATYFPIARYEIKNLSVSPLIYASIPFLIVDVYSLKPSYFGKSHHTHCCNVRSKGRRYLLHRCRVQHLRHQPWDIIANNNIVLQPHITFPITRSQCPTTIRTLFSKKYSSIKYIPTGLKHSISPQHQHWSSKLLLSKRLWLLRRVIPWAPAPEAILLQRQSTRMRGIGDDGCDCASCQSGLLKQVQCGKLYGYGWFCWTNG